LKSFFAGVKEGKMLFLDAIYSYSIIEALQGLREEQKNSALSTGEEINTCKIIGH
jgi:hypothetical protein